MNDWVIGRLQDFVGRTDREKLVPRVRDGLVKQVMGDTTSYRMARSLPALGRGLVVTEEGVIPDYGRVRRVFHLANAIVKYYYSPFYVEEKVPGYQARGGVDRRSADRVYPRRPVLRLHDGSCARLHSR